MEKTTPDRQALMDPRNFIFGFGRRYVLFENAVSFTLTALLFLDVVLELT